MMPKDKDKFKYICDKTLYLPILHLVFLCFILVNMLYFTDYGKKSKFDQHMCILGT